MLADSTTLQMYHKTSYGPHVLVSAPSSKRVPRAEDERQHDLSVIFKPQQPAHDLVRLSVPPARLFVRTSANVWRHSQATDPDPFILINIWFPVVFCHAVHRMIRTQSNIWLRELSTTCCDRLFWWWLKKTRRGWLSHLICHEVRCVSSEGYVLV